MLELAGQKSPEALSVSEVARAAGVHRSTFYEHSDSPAELLRTVLRAELDATRERHLSGDAPRDWALQVRQTTLEVLEHLERHRTVYLRSFASPADASLRTMLSEHVRASVLLLLERGAVSTPVQDPALAAQYLAEGAVGALSVWLAGPAPRSAEAFLADYARLVPPWWPVGEG